MSFLTSLTIFLSFRRKECRCFNPLASYFTLKKTLNLKNCRSFFYQGGAHASQNCHFLLLPNLFHVRKSRYFSSFPTHYRGAWGQKKTPQGMYPQGVGENIKCPCLFQKPNTHPKSFSRRSSLLKPHLFKPQGKKPLAYSVFVVFFAPVRISLV